MRVAPESRGALGDERVIGDRGGGIAATMGAVASLMVGTHDVAEWVGEGIPTA